MLSPATQTASCTFPPSETRQENDEKTICFYGRKITELPGDVLWMITHYLSLDDIHNLGLTSRKMKNALMACRSFEARHYRRLPKYKQLFYRNVSITNLPLIHYLKTEKIQIIADQFHPDENLPALCAYHADCLRRQTINAPSVHCVLKETFGEEVRIDSYQLNEHHTQLLIKSEYDKYSLWSKNIDDSWKHEITIGEIYLHDCVPVLPDWKNIFIPLRPRHWSLGYIQYHAEDPLLSIFGQSDCGSWSETQKLTFGAIYSKDDSEKTFFWPWIHLIPSPDSNSVIYHNANKRGSIVLSRGLNGHWISSGHIPYGERVFFSPDSNHIVVGDDDGIHFFGKKRDGSWSGSGEIIIEIDATQLSTNDLDHGGFDEFAFSPDSRHFSACFNEANSMFDFDAVYLSEFFVVIASLGEDGNWSETTKIIKRSEQPEPKYALSAKFSPDGKYLVVGARNNFDVWRLNDDNSWSPTIDSHHYDRWFPNFARNPVVTFTKDSAAFMLTHEGFAMVWRLSDYGMWQCEHSFSYKTNPFSKRRQIEFGTHIEAKINADGKWILTTNKNGFLDIWARNQQGEWSPQHFDNSVRIIKPCFNQESYLLAGLDVEDNCRLIVLGLTKNETWKVKGCLQQKSRIIDFSFSSCGHSLQVSCDNDHRKVITFWQLLPEPLESASTQLPEPDTPLIRQPTQTPMTDTAGHGSL